MGPPIPLKGMGSFDEWGIKIRRVERQGLIVGAKSIMISVGL